MYGVIVYRSKSKVKFLCGDQQTDWAQLHVTGLVADRIVSTTGVDSQFLSSVSNTFWAILGLRHERIQYGLPSFSKTLQIFRQSICFDPRDKVYAPLCLASDEVRYSITPKLRQQNGP